jgi:signal transduction histidine kinase
MAKESVEPSESHFASPERTPPEVLSVEIDAIARSPVVDGLLKTVEGLVAVLDENRQLVALNHALLESAGIERPEEALGLRPGELLGCTHATEMPAGCGTSRFCSTCGAAIAITTSLAKDHPVERMCALHVRSAGRERDLYLSVRAVPIRVSAHRYLLVFMQDVTHAQALAALERVFFHDVNNLLSGLLGGAELLTEVESAEEAHELARDVATLTRRLHREVSVQRALVSDESPRVTAIAEPTTAEAVLAEVARVFAHHPAARGMHFVVVPAPPQLALRLDVPFLLRVLSNMVTNALEASEPGATVTLSARLDEPGTVRFEVHSAKVIPADVQRRIFQRNFSTKRGEGRGLGTYSMKLLGEQALGGRVDFTSSEEDGTRFFIQLPVAAR